MPRQPDAAEAAPLRPADDFRAYPPISDYAAIGDCRTIALVSRQGSIDWLCLPASSSPAIFAALLDRRQGGRFAIRPSEPFRVRRCYVAGTNVLETTFETTTGTVRLTDLMVLTCNGRRHEPERELLRIAEGLDGETPLEIIYDPSRTTRRQPRARCGAARRWAGSCSTAARRSVCCPKSSFDRRPCAG